MIIMKGEKNMLLSQLNPNDFPSRRSMEKASQKEAYLSTLNSFQKKEFKGVERKLYSLKKQYHSLSYDIYSNKWNIKMNFLTKLKVGEDSKEIERITDIILDISNSAKKCNAKVTF